MKKKGEYTVKGFNMLLVEHAESGNVLAKLEEWLKWVIVNFSRTIKLDRDYSKEENKINHDILVYYTFLAKELLKSREWHDVFGEIYEMNVSTKKIQHTGQFFTPVPIVNFQCMILSDKDEKGLKVNDPACGSARYLIAHHAFTGGGNLYFGEDIDYLCCLMSVVNMMFHGAVGEIVWHNSLMPDHYLGGWRINQYLNRTGLPHIENLEKDQSYVIEMWHIREVMTTIEKTTPVDSDKKTGEQLSFDF